MRQLKDERGGALFNSWTKTDLDVEAQNSIDDNAQQMFVWYVMSMFARTNNKTQILSARYHDRLEKLLGNSENVVAHPLMKEYSLERIRSGEFPRQTGSMLNAVCNAYKVS